MAVEPDYECALDRLGQLDKQYKDKNFGFYGKYFRQNSRKEPELLQVQEDQPSWTSTLMKRNMLIPMLSCILRSQPLRNIFMDLLLFMVVMTIVFELPTVNQKNNDQLRLRHSLEKGSWNWRIFVSEAGKDEHFLGWFGFWHSCVVFEWWENGKELRVLGSSSKSFDDSIRQDILQGGKSQVSFPESCFREQRFVFADA